MVKPSLVNRTEGWMVVSNGFRSSVISATPTKTFSFSFERLKRGQGLRLIPIQIQVLIFVINPSKQLQEGKRNPLLSHKHQRLCRPSSHSKILLQHYFCERWGWEIKDSKNGINLKCPKAGNKKKNPLMVGTDGGFMITFSPSCPLGPNTQNGCKHVLLQHKTPRRS